MSEEFMNFEQIYQRLFKPVLNYIYSRVSGDTAAEDIACLVWQKVYQKLEQFDPEKGLPEQWIFTIARNETNKYFRFQKLKRFFVLFEETSTQNKEKSILDILSTQEQNYSLFNALEILSKREKDLISLKFFSGLNNRQIASVCQLSESNVGTILNRALKKLRAELEQV